MRLRVLLLVISLFSIGALKAQDCQPECSPSIVETEKCCPPVAEVEKCCPPVVEAKKCCPPVFQRGMGLNCNQYPAAYNAPAKVSLLCDWDVDFTASFIYWHVSQENMDIAYIPPFFTGSGAASTPGAVAYQNFEFKPGFKLGLGFETGYDDWVFSAEYTWLHQDTSQVVAAPAGTQAGWFGNEWFTGYNTVQPEVNTTASPSAGLALTDTTYLMSSLVGSAWFMHMDQIDLVMSRPFYQGTQLTISPAGGLRALWIGQHLVISLPYIAASTTSHSESWALGPMGGLTSHWLMGSGFRFEGKCGASLLYAQYKVNQEQVGAPSRQPVTSASPKIRELRPTMDMGLGLGWGTYFGCNQYYLDFALRYDCNLFFNQNMMREWVGNLQGYAIPAGNLYLHGLTVDARFDF